MTIPEYKTTTIEKQKFIVSHYGLWKSCWDWLILIVSFYVAIVVPYNATFKTKPQQQKTSDLYNSFDGDNFAGDMKNDCEIDTFDIFVEVVFIIDVILNFRTTFVNRKGEVVTRPRIISKHYVKSWFLVDACAALPFDLLCGLNLYSRSRINVDLNLLKLIRLLRLARLLQKMDRYSQYSYIILTLLMLIFSLLAHWCACIWYVIAKEEIDRNPHGWKMGWLHQLSDKLGYNVVNDTDMSSAYVTALYFTTSSLTSVGFGNVSANTVAEKIFSIVIMLIGALMHAVVFGNVTALIRVMYARRSNYQTRLRDLKDFFRLHQLPKDLQQRMSDYFQTTWSLNHGIDTYEILKDFPDELRGDVSLHLHREVLSLPIFASAPQGFLKSLARHIESKFCCPTEYLIHRGDALSYLYLVCNGSMEVLQDNMVVGILGKGDLVGYDVNASTMTPDHTSQFLGSNGHLTSAPSGANLNSCPGAMQQSHSMGIVNGSCLPTLPPTSLSIIGSGLAGAGVAQKTSAPTGGLVKSSSDLKALTYCDLKCIHIGGLLDVLKLYPEFADTFHEEIIHDLSFNLREQHEEHDEEPEEEEEDDDDQDEEEEDEDDEDRSSWPGDGGGGNGGHSQPGHFDDDDSDERGGTPGPQQGDTKQVDNQEGEMERGEERGGRQHSSRSSSSCTDDELGQQRPMTRKISGSLEQLEKKRARQSESKVESGSVAELTFGRDHSARSSQHMRHGVFAAGHANTTAGATADLLGEASFSQSYDGLDESGSAAGRASSPRNNLASRFSKLSRCGRMPLAIGEQNENDSPSNNKVPPGGAAKVLNQKRKISKNKSDETVLETAQLKRTNGIGGSPLVGAVSPRPLRPAIGGHSNSSTTGGPHNGVASRAQKPPISFDLSRNTMAIVDRRRRSAGCIQRPLAITSMSAATDGNQATRTPPTSVDSPLRQQQAIAGGPTMVSNFSTPTKTRCHSSLIHISENEPMSSNQSATIGSGTPAAAARTPRRLARVASGAATNSTSRKFENSLERLDSLGSGELSSRGKLLNSAAQTSYSNQDFLQIDAHITASVQRMRQEFRRELHTAIDSLARLILERDTERENCGTSRVSSRQRRPVGVSSSEQRVDSGPSGGRPNNKALRGQLQTKQISNGGGKGPESSSMSRSMSAVSFTGIGASGAPSKVMVVSGSGSGSATVCELAACSPPARTVSLRQLGNGETVGRPQEVALGGAELGEASGSCGSGSFVGSLASGSSLATFGGESPLQRTLPAVGGRPARLLLKTSNSDSCGNNNGNNLNNSPKPSPLPANSGRESADNDQEEQTADSYTIDINEDSSERQHQQVGNNLCDNKRAEPTIRQRNQSRQGDRSNQLADQHDYRRRN